MQGGALSKHLPLLVLFGLLVLERAAGGGEERLLERLDPVTVLHVLHGLEEEQLAAVENLSYAARFYGMRPSETREQIPVILERVGFPASRRNDPMEHLSRGMQQKVALARALLTSPVLLLLDEPTTGLDPRSKLEVQDFIREVQATHDATILLCTHDMTEAEILAERVGILDDGRLLVLEPADDLKARYGASTLEEAFFAATGKSFEEEGDPEDEEDEG